MFEIKNLKKKRKIKKNRNFSVIINHELRDFLFLLRLIYKIGTR